MKRDDDRDIKFIHPDAFVSRRVDDKNSAHEPAAITPRSIMPRAPRRGKGFVRKLLVLVLLGVLILSAIYVLYIISIVAKISTNSWQIAPLAADNNGRTNIVVLGIGDPGHAGENLTDTILVVSLDGPGRRLAEVGVPRDLRVDLPGYGYSKINAANAYGGTDLAEKTVSATLGIPIHYYVKTNFSGLKDIVDAVGGLDVTVNQRLVDTEYPCDDNQYKVCGLDIEAGLQHMNGARVLQYVRCRKGTCGNDFGRAARQQDIITLLRPKVTDPALLLHPYQLKTLVSAVQKGINTNLGLAQLVELVLSWKQAANNQSVNLVLSTAPGGYLRSDPAGSSDLLPVGGDFSAISARVQDIFAASPSPAAQ